MPASTPPPARLPKAQFSRVWGGTYNPQGWHLSCGKAPAAGPELRGQHRVREPLTQPLGQVGGGACSRSPSTGGRSPRPGGSRLALDAGSKPAGRAEAPGQRWDSGQARGCARLHFSLLWAELGHVVGRSFENGGGGGPAESRGVGRRDSPVCPWRSRPPSVDTAPSSRPLFPESDPPPRSQLLPQARRLRPQPHLLPGTPLPL